MKNKIAIGILSVSMVLSVENALACYKEKREVVLKMAQQNHDTDINIKNGFLTDLSRAKPPISNNAKNSSYMDKPKTNNHLHINKDCLELSENPPHEFNIQFNTKQPLRKINF